MAVLYLLLVYVASALSQAATDEKTMLDHMLEYSDTQGSGVLPDTYPLLAESITGYLAGTRESPQVILDAGTMRREAFSPQEVEHLQDIRALVGLSRILKWVALGMIALLGIAYALLRVRAPQLLGTLAPQRQAAWGIASFIVLISGVAIWGAVDFISLFRVFHQLLFTNELWLLDPQRDLLMQLMPQPFFVSFAWDILKQNILFLLILPLALYGLLGNGGIKK